VTQIPPFFLKVGLTQFLPPLQFDLTEMVKVPIFHSAGFLAPPSRRFFWSFDVLSFQWSLISVFRGVQVMIHPFFLPD